MKNLKSVLVFLALGAFLASCVSAKKYEESVAANHRMLSELNQAKAKIDSLKTYGEKALEEREEAIIERERKLEKMSDIIEAQRLAVVALHEEVCSALKCFTPDELSVEVMDGKLYVSLSDKLLFPSGSDRVNARGKEALSAMAAVLANSDLEIIVEGHTDSVPIQTACLEDNWDLSAHRATSVSRILIDYGIDPNRIAAAGRGEFQPIANNATADGRQANRRTEIVLAPKLDKLWELTEMQEALSQNK